MKSVALSKMFHVNQRFTRSVHLAYDYSDDHALDGYIVTPLSLSILNRFVSCLNGERRNRAFSVTGPYGTGKSACCLFASQVVSPATSSSGEQARTLLRQSSMDSFKKVDGLLNRKGLLPILVSGSRRSIGLAILDGLIESINKLDGAWGAESLRKKIAKLRRQAAKGKLPDDKQVIESIRKLLVIVTRSDLYKGSMLVIDEMGKLLEYAALHPKQSDIFILQELAELASRSGSVPFLVITVLHQSFDRYASHLGQDQRVEWAKIQGRFEDLGFLENTDQFLNLVGKAIERRQLNGYTEVISREVKKAISLKIKPRGVESEEARQTLEGCAPLHPVTSLLIGPLFRSKLAQNERSLFAFLSSSEPNGFKQFLEDPKYRWSKNGIRPFYRLDQLYDYVYAIQGSSLGALSDGKRWVEIEDALSRLPKDAGSLDERVVKAVGMLGIFGDKQLIKASPTLISYALDDGSYPKGAILKAVKKLEARSVLLYRKHQNAYVLWEGSDVNLENRYQAAVSHLGRLEDLAGYLREYASLQPYVAKKHLYETGTLRFFKPVLINEESIDDISEDILGTEDGVIVYVLPDNKKDPRKVINKAKTVSSQLPDLIRDQILFAVPGETEAIQGALNEVVAWEWVTKNTPELEGDRVARKELASHKSDAYGRLDRICARVFDKESAHLTCTWIYRGEKLNFNSARQMMSNISNIFDEVFARSPRIISELANRQSLSTSAASARRTLLESMLGDPNSKGFGIEGTPPEKSMYISIFQNTGFHKLSGDKFIFDLPQHERRRRGNIRPTWKAMQHFLESTKTGRKNVNDLYELLRKKPFGIKEGLLPIFLVAKLVSHPDEVAVFEVGIYVPVINAALLERLMKAPGRFELQFFPVDKSRSQILEKLVSIVDKSKRHDQNTLLTALRPLYSFISKLPDYTLKTSAISEEAKKVREIILKAKEPHQVLFNDIPLALGLVPNSLEVDTYFTSLKRNLVELQNAYQSLLRDCERSLCTALSLDIDGVGARKVLTEQAELVVDAVSDMHLKAFALRLTDTSLDHDLWLESIMDIVIGKVPSTWKDLDVAQFEINVTDLGRRFTRVVEIVIDQGKAKTMVARVFRVGITDPTGGEISRVLFVSDEAEEKSQIIADKLELLLKSESSSNEVHQAAVIELARREVLKTSK